MYIFFVQYINGYAETVYMSPTPMRPEVTVEPEDAW